MPCICFLALWNSVSHLQHYKAMYHILYSLPQHTKLVSLSHVWESSFLQKMISHTRMWCPVLGDEGLEGYFMILVATYSESKSLHIVLFWSWRLALKKYYECLFNDRMNEWMNEWHCFQCSFVVSLTPISCLLLPSTHILLSTLLGQSWWVFRSQLLEALGHTKLGSSSPAAACTLLIVFTIEWLISSTGTMNENRGVISLVSVDWFKMRWTTNSNTFFRVRHSVAIGIESHTW